LITAGQLRAARALLGIDQKKLADMSGVSVPTIQRMEASEGIVRGNAETLTKVIDALSRAGIELLTAGGRGVRLKDSSGSE
jgi:predicted transcriptional regulator